MRSLPGWCSSLLPKARGQASRSVSISKMTRGSAAAVPDYMGDPIFSFAESRYIAPRSAQTFVISHPSVPPKTQDFGLASVFRLPRTEKPQIITADWVQGVIEDYERNDDVFETTFLKTVIFSGAAEEADIDFTHEADEYLKKLGNKHIIFVPATSNISTTSEVPMTSDMLPGPYAIIGNELRDVWKIIDDSYGTCMSTLKPQLSPSDPFEIFQHISAESQFPCFALRSRIKARAAIDSPLAGLRVVIKDNIHLRGTRVSQGNKAFHDTFPPQEESAKCIQKLIEKGVSIVGKTKMNSFGNWEEPLEYIDYQAPWNPRGDRYQSTGGSSSGSAAAVAGYDWLDVAIGTDTWGSVTRPSLWCGLFGLRPTKGSLSIEGIEPFCQIWDTAGILGKDLQKCRDFAAQWLNPEVLVKPDRSFSEIIWPADFWEIIDGHQVELAVKFTARIGASLGLASREVSFQDAWTRKPPPEAAGLSLQDYIVDATKSQCYDAYHNCHEFRVKYRDQFGTAPYVSPGISGMWSFAKNMSKEHRDMGFERLAVYKRWFNDVVVSGGNPLIIMPLESMAPRYRDEAPSFKRPPQDGVNALALAAVLGSPALAVPVAEIPYYSRITDQEEKLPFVVAIMSGPGTDLVLIDTVQEALARNRLPTRVETGKTMLIDKSA